MVRPMRIINLVRYFSGDTVRPGPVFRRERRARRYLTVALAIGAAETAVAMSADKAATQALEDLIETHRNMDPVAIEFTMTMEIRDGDVASRPRKVDGRMAVGPDGRGVLSVRGYTSRVADRRIVITHEDTADRRHAIVERAGGPALTTLNTAFHSLPIPVLALHWGGNDVDEIAATLHPQTPDLTPHTYQAGDADGGDVLVLTEPDGRLELTVDDESGRLHGASHVLDSGSRVPDGVAIHSHFEFSYEPIDVSEIDDAVAFDRGDRRRVTRLSSLRGSAEADEGRGRMAIGGAESLEGRPAPDIVLTTADGGQFDLNDLRGRAVVLDFWATWCQPCHRILPVLHDIADWADEEGLPVDVMTVNVLERQHDSPEQRLEAVREFWQQGNYELPVAMDYSGDVARDYSVQSIPMTVVIAPDGAVEYVHIGAGGSYRESVKEAITDAIEP